MPGSLYETDAFTWSRRHADLLRRLARGERVNAEIDWRHVVEEVRDVGLSELRAVRSLLAKAIEHIMKVYSWPDCPVEQWAAEGRAFLADAERSYVPSMRRSVHLGPLYASARAIVLARTIDGRRARPIRTDCPYQPADLLPPVGIVADVDALARRLEAGDG